MFLSAARAAVLPMDPMPDTLPFVLSETRSRCLTPQLSVITSAGIIFAASMLGLMFGSIAIMIQAGFIIGCGLLLDTFVVRTLTVPAIAVLLREASWWPQRASARSR